jgi:hypothetical protein
MVLYIDNKKNLQTGAADKKCLLQVKTASINESNVSGLRYQSFHRHL